jgi:hypothetical protein
MRRLVRLVQRRFGLKKSARIMPSQANAIGPPFGGFDQATRCSLPSCGLQLCLESFPM